jgi:hypothetical protein
VLPSEVHPAKGPRVAELEPVTLPIRSGADGRVYRHGAGRHTNRRPRQLADTRRARFSPKRKQGRRLPLDRHGSLAPTVGTKASAPAWHPGGMRGVEVGAVITVLTVEAALEHICGSFRERADRGDITPAERDLLTDGAILLAMHIDDLAGEGRAGPASGWSELGRPAPSGRHERYLATAAA